MKEEIPMSELKLKTVTAIYNNKNEAKNAILHLKSKGIDISNVSILGAEDSIDEDMNMDFESEKSVSEKGASGAALGAAVGASVLALTTFTAATLTGGAALLGAGPLIAALAGGTAGATAGGLIGGFIGIGIPEVEARIIEEKLGEGRIVLGVQVDNDSTEKVKEALQITKGERIVAH